MSGHSQHENIYDYDHVPTSGPAFAYTYPQHIAYHAHANVPRSYGPIAQPSHDEYDLETHAYRAQPPAPAEASARLLLEVLSFSPASATPGTPLCIRFRSVQALTRSAFRFFILISNLRCEASLRRPENPSSYDEYILLTRVPSVEEEFNTESVTLNINVLDGMGRDYGIFHVGVLYLELASRQRTSSPSASDQPRKRRVSDDSSHAPTKKSSLQHLQHRHRGQSFGSDSSGANVPQETNNQQRLQQPVTSEATPYTTATSVPSTHPFISNRVEASTKPQGHQASFYNPTSDSVISSRPKPYQGLSQSSRPSLIRTSTLFPTQISGSSVVSPSPSFKTYGTQPAQAILVIENDLDAMAHDWTAEEMASNRRLVEFERKQTNSVITTSFKPVTLEQRAPNSICVSCIWWEERRESFITSVDTIYLLESLVAVRFTVEEKNRIRRNLEGFRPLTVSKGKADSEEFFKIIMGFPNPKPRNIEKDVKAFPWRILAIALKKIISKYSATPLPSASTMVPHVSSSLERRASPSSTSSSVASMPQPSAGGSIAFSTPDSGLGSSRSLSKSTGPPDLLASTLPQHYPAYGPFEGSWQREQPTNELPAYAMTGSWGLGQYIEPGPPTALPSEYQYDPHSSMQAQAGNQYADANHLYMPYNQDTSSHP